MPTGKKFKSKFIQAGLANYPNSFGIALIRKESFDKFINTLEGKPVIINHQDVTKDNFKDVEVGTVCNVWYDPNDGWYWCDGVITDETAIELIKNKGWSVSCSYNITLANDEGGLENNVHYDIEFLDGVFTHLAIVDNPRYERANIVLNSKTEFLNEDITIANGGDGSGDFDHAGRPGEVGGSEPAGTGRGGKYSKDGKRNWVGAKPQQKSLFNEEDEQKEEDNKNEKEQEMALLEELKKLIASVDNAKDDKKDDCKKADNEHVDKRELIDEVGGILKDKVDDEIIRTIIGKIEKVAYDQSEAKDDKKADNEVIIEEPKKEEKKEEDDKKVEELEKDVKEDVENKCKNSVDNAVDDNKVDNAREDYFTKLYQVYNSSMELPKSKEHITQSDRLEYGKKF